MLIVAGYIYVDPQDVVEFIADARANIPDAHAADGCLFFSHTMEEPTIGSILVLERWRDQKALNTYLATPQVAATYTKWASKMRSDVRKFDASNERGPKE